LSIFSGLSPESQKALAEFVKLPLETQSYLIALLEKGELEGVPDDQAGIFNTLTFEIRLLLSIHSNETLVTGLKEIGMQETIARVLVDQVEKLAPTPEMNAQVLSKLNPDVFDKVSRFVIVDFYLNGRRDWEQASRELGVSIGVLDAFLSIARDTVIYPVLRGERLPDTVAEALTDLGLATDRSKIIQTLVLDNLQQVRDTRLFDETWSTRTRVQRLEESQQDTLSVVKEILELLKKTLAQKGSSPATYG
jgi:hypothetical protein